jgi:hypothetical protein
MLAWRCRSDVRCAGAHSRKNIGRVIEPAQPEALLPFNLTEGEVIDRAARVVVGLGLVAAAYANALGPLAWIGVVPLVTGIIGTCPVYRMLGIDTCSLGRS